METRPALSSLSSVVASADMVDNDGFSLQNNDTIPMEQTSPLSMSTPPTNDKDVQTKLESWLTSFDTKLNVIAPSPKKRKTMMSSGEPSSSTGSQANDLLSTTSVTETEGKTGSTGRWTDAEHKAFLVSLAKHGREWNRVAVDIPTRTSAQVRSHAQKYFAKQAKSSNNKKEEQQQQLHTIIEEESIVSQGMMSASPRDAVDSDDWRSSYFTEQRIVSSPETVEQEVQDTLRQLHERYLYLQQRLQEKKERQQASDDAKSTTTIVATCSNDMMEVTSMIPEDDSHDSRTNRMSDIHIPRGVHYFHLHEQPVSYSFEIFDNDDDMHSNVTSSNNSMVDDNTTTTFCPEPYSRPNIEEVIAVQVLHRGLRTYREQQ